jgi:hypothetical protein
LWSLRRHPLFHASRRPGAEELAQDDDDARTLLARSLSLRSDGCWPRSPRCTCTSHGKLHAWAGAHPSCRACVHSSESSVVVDRARHRAPLLGDGELAWHLTRPCAGACTGGAAGEHPGRHARARGSGRRNHARVWWHRGTRDAAAGTRARARRR